MKIASAQINFEELNKKIKQYALLKQWKKVEELIRE
jgi:hypothetical protein